MGDHEQTSCAGVDQGSGRRAVGRDSCDRALCEIKIIILLMNKVFDRKINNVNYTFYRYPLFREVIYNVSILQQGKATVFVMRNKDNRWYIFREHELPDFVYSAEKELREIIEANEGKR